jgi:hypothetical protein
MTLFGERKYRVKCIKQVSPKQLVKFVQNLNNKKYAQVKTDEHLSSEFKVNERFRQGD